MLELEVEVEWNNRELDGAANFAQVAVVARGANVILESDWVKNVIMMVGYAYRYR